MTYEEGRSDALLDIFYRLLVRTRRRHEWPPQPRDWFQNLVDCLGDKVKIRVASKDGRTIASIVTLAFKDVLVFKYGCSDERFHNLGAVHLLFWSAMQDGKGNGAREFDLGRSDADNAGLIAFKDRWGATRSPLTYWRSPGSPRPTALARWGTRLARKILAHAPETVLVAAGKTFYRHFGSKRDLYCACLDEMWRRLRDTVEQVVADEPDPREWLFAVLRRWHSPNDPLQQTGPA